MEKANNQSSNNSRIAQNSIFMIIRMLILMIVNLFTTRIVLHTIGVVDFGVHSTVAGFVTMFGFLNSTLTSASQRFYNYELGKNGEEGVLRVFNASIKIHFLLSLIVFFAAECFGVWYIENMMVLPADRHYAALFVFHSSVFSLLFTILATPFSSVIIAFERINCYAIISIFDALFKLALILLIPFSGADSLILYGLIFAIVSLVDTILYIYFAKKYVPFLKFIKHRGQNIFRSILLFSGWRLIDSLSYMIREQGINLLLNFLYGPIVNAARSISFQINSAMQAFLNNIITPIRPQLTQSYAAGNVQRSVRLTYFMSKVSFLCLFIVSLPIIFEVDFVLNFWLSGSIPEHANTFTRYLLITNLAGTFIFPICNLVQANGNLKYYEILSSSSNFLSVPLAFIFLYYYNSPETVYIALFIINILNTAVGLIAVKKLMPFSIIDFLRSTLVGGICVVVVSTPIVFVPYLYFDPSTIRFAFVLLTSLLITILSSYFIGLNSSERSFLNQTIGFLFNKFKNNLAMSKFGVFAKK